MFLWCICICLIVSFLCTQYLRLSTTVQEDDIRTHFMNMWDTPPELSITFLGGCDEYFVSEKIKKCLMHCISGVSRLKVHIYGMQFSYHMLSFGKNQMLKSSSFFQLN